MLISFRPISLGNAIYKVISKKMAIEINIKFRYNFLGVVLYFYVHIIVVMIDHLLKKPFYRLDATSCLMQGSVELSELLPKDSYQRTSIGKLCGRVCASWRDRTRKGRGWSKNRAGGRPTMVYGCGRVL